MVSLKVTVLNIFLVSFMFLFEKAFEKGFKAFKVCGVGKKRVRKQKSGQISVWGGVMALGVFKFVLSVPISTTL